MGKITGFLDFQRRDRSYAPIAERVTHWREFTQPLADDELQRQGGRCMDCGIPFCHQGCPVNNIIPEWNDRTYQDDPRGALAVLHQTNNFPDFTGRICPAPCEASCTLNLIGQPVTIKTIEHAIVERGWREGWIEPQIAARHTGKRIAVIGSGPAGLACAQQLGRAGHDVQVFEKAPRIGGLLRYGIPDFKLEKTVIDRRIAQMRSEGSSSTRTAISASMFRPSGSCAIMMRSCWRSVPRRRAICRCRAATSAAFISPWNSWPSRIAASPAKRWRKPAAFSPPIATCW